MRNVILLLLLALGGWFGMGQAQAACTGNTCDTKAEAYAYIPAYWEPWGTCANFGVPGGARTITYQETDVWADGSHGRVTGNLKCNGSTVDTASATWASLVCPAPNVWDQPTHSCAPPPCAAGSEGGLTWGSHLNSTSCHSDGNGHMCEWLGAESSAIDSGGNEFAQWVAVGTTCNPDSYECLPGYTEMPDGTCRLDPECPAGSHLDGKSGTCIPDDECPAGQSMDPVKHVCRPEKDDCPVGEVSGPDGSCVKDDNCPVHSVRGKDGTCKPDLDDDGEPDDGTEHTATDSNDCATPPVCGGDEIMCLHAKQLWRIECNTRKNGNVDLDAYCGHPPICERHALGDSDRTTGCTDAEEASMFLQWKTMCDVGKMLKLQEEGGAPDSGSDGDANTHNPDGHDSTSAVNGSSDGSGLLDQVVKEGESHGADGLDTTGLGFSRTCPQVAPIEVMGVSIDLNRPELCDWMLLGGQFVMLMAALASLRVMGGVFS